MHPRFFAKVVSAFAALLALGTVPVSAAILLNARADIVPGQDARASLTFEGGIPRYRIYGNGGSDVSLVLLGTTRAANTASLVGGKNGLKNIAIEQLSGSVAVTFHAASSANISVASGNSQGLIASLHLSGPQADPPGEAQFSLSSSQSPPTLAAMAPGALMEVVPLKYSDVGEVVGILVPGQQIPSHDTGFRRRHRR
jgi:hypothetical protein